MRKKIDSRIRTLVENVVKLHQRGMFVIIGDKARDQVVNLHYMLSKTVVKSRPTVLWCYKKDLYLSSHRKKRVKQIRKAQQRGLLDVDKEDPFALFVSATSIRYCFYHETHNILGNTYGMAVLQDFEALTPNLLARTIETVEGGGLVILLLSKLSSLTQLYSLTMDVHARLRTEAHQDVVGRFNERLVLSLASCPNCLICDDELNVLPTSSLVREICPVEVGEDGRALNDPGREARTELAELAGSLADTLPAGPLVGRCRTLDQARAVVTFLDAASEKTLRSTVALTASRGRGKSAALGLAIAGALGLGYANIFVTAPSPENLNTLFQFVFKGLDALGYSEHIDYDLVQSTNPAFGKAVVRVNVFRAHRQTVQYIQPQHSASLAQAELLVIDEAAAIPLPVVRNLLGPYLVFLCSTVNGYEGTGRSLSLKLISQLREQGAKLASGDSGAASTGRLFREVTLSEPIRYAPGDPVESWLHELLCLDAANALPRPPARLPHPSECELYFLERDTLFSYHRASEKFLQACVALYTASHYKNTPNDLLLMSDAPAHQLFVLLAPVDETQNVLPDILAVVQVALEGRISSRAASSSLARGEMPSGDLLPWTVAQQFQDAAFPGLSGARVVRIAVHPELTRAGYGSRCLELLKRYYQGELTSLDDEGDDDEDAGAPSTSGRPGSSSVAAEGGLLTETVKPRSGLPPLLVRLADRPPERLHYLGVSFGLTLQLLSFWRRAGFSPLYIRQSASDVTGENTVVLAAPLRSPDVEGTDWLQPFVTDFRCRFMSLLPGPFKDLEPALVLSILDPKLSYAEGGSAPPAEQLMPDGAPQVTRSDGSPLTPYDLKRLQAYANNLVDYHLVLDLLPPLCRAYFSGRLPTSLSYSQAAILTVLGLQQRELADVERELKLPGSQVLALFNKAVRKLHALLHASRVAALERTLPRPAPRMTAADQGPSGSSAPLADLDAELNEAAAVVQAEMRARFRADELAHFAVAGAEEDFASALGGGRPSSGGIVQVKSSKSKSDGTTNHKGGSIGGSPMLYKKSGKVKDKRKGGEKFGGHKEKRHKS